jgi:type VI secretion system secreted protein VgrG
MDANVPFRPPRATPKPRISGVLSGVVQAPAASQGDAAFIDERGRYIVQMHFDRMPQSGPRASLPIRMAQPHAGAHSGIHFPLRPGTEVLVAFVGGDPDRPVIVGAVHHAAMANPVTRADATRNRIRTASGIVIEINDGS